MTEILEGLRGPVLGLIFVIFALAGMIVTAAFAALVAQMSLLLRLRPRETHLQQQAITANRSRPSASSPYRSVKHWEKEPKIEDTTDLTW